MVRKRRLCFCRSLQCYPPAWGQYAAWEAFWLCLLPVEMGNGSIGVQGWQRDRSVAGDSSLLLPPFGCPWASDSWAPLLNPHRQARFPSHSQHMGLRKELGFIFSITSIRIWQQTVRTYTCWWLPVEKTRGLQGTSGADLGATSTPSIKHLHGDRLRPICDTAAKKAAFLHSDLLWERWDACAAGLAGIFSTFFTSGSCR